MRVLYYTCKNENSRLHGKMLVYDTSRQNLNQRATFRAEEKTLWAGRCSCCIYIRYFKNITSKFPPCRFERRFLYHALSPPQKF